MKHMPQQQINICLASFYKYRIFRRQTPRDDFVWGPLHISYNDETACSWLCVYDDVPRNWTTTIPRHRRILVVVEPKEIVDYSSTYLNQYGTVLSPYPRPSSYGGRWVNAPILFYWIYGYKEYHYPLTYKAWDELKKPKIKKKKTLSIIYTRKCRTESQCQRGLFVDALQQELGHQLNIFGRAIKYIDKEDGIDPYRYHLVVENGTGPHFWSEKLADCYLGESYPIHAGCTNLHDYFPRQAYTSIDIFNIPQAIQKVKEVIASDLWHKNRAHILEAKRRVMEEHQLFPMLERIICHRSHEPYQALAQPVLIHRAGGLVRDPPQQLTTIKRLIHRYVDPRRRYVRRRYWSRKIQSWRQSIKKRYPFS